jgi:hypothetical protein
MGATAATEQAVGVGGRWRSSRVAWAERERGRGSWAEGPNERGEVGEQGAGLKRGTGARTWPENVRSWARPRREIMGERLETVDRWGRRDRERGSGRARGKQRRQLDPTVQREREGRDRARVGADRRDPPVRQRGRAGARVG